MELLYFWCICTMFVFNSVGYACSVHVRCVLPWWLCRSREYSFWSSVFYMGLLTSKITKTNQNREISYCCNRCNLLSMSSPSSISSTSLPSLIAFILFVSRHTGLMFVGFIDGTFFHHFFLFLSRSLYFPCFICRSVLFHTVTCIERFTMVLSTIRTKCTSRIYWMG